MLRLLKSAIACDSQIRNVLRRKSSRSTTEGIALTVISVFGENYERTHLLRCLKEEARIFNKCCNVRFISSIEKARRRTGRLLSQEFLTNEIPEGKGAVGRGWTAKVKVVNDGIKPVLPELRGTRRAEIGVGDKGYACTCMRKKKEGPPRRTVVTPSSHVYLRHWNRIEARGWVRYDCDTYCDGGASKTGDWYDQQNKNVREPRPGTGSLDLQGRPTCTGTFQVGSGPPHALSTMTLPMHYGTGTPH